MCGLLSCGNRIDTVLSIAIHPIKPNIIYILGDDVGWGELGWQGGGKHRGTPSPALHQMAFEECGSGRLMPSPPAHRPVLRL